MTPEQAAYLFERLEDIGLYIRHELIWDLKFVLFKYVGPLLVSGLALQGFLGLLKFIYKIIFPPDAAELHRNALAALHHHKRVRRDDKVHQQEAEQILLKAIARDDQYFPAYLSLVALYIYRLKSPQKALEILDMAQDRLSKSSNNCAAEIQAFRLDAIAMKEGGNENMIVAGGSLFAEHEYLSAVPSTKQFSTQQPQQQTKQQSPKKSPANTTTKDKTS